MKYILNKNIIITKQNNKIILENTKNNAKITFPTIIECYLNEIFSGIESEIIINNFKEKENYSEEESKKQINKIIYCLLHQNIINADTKTSINGKPINIQSVLIELTDTCNYRCPHCYVNKTSNNIITLNEAKDICKELKTLKCNRVALTGGEVFTNTDFLEIYKHFYDEGFIVSVNTNLSLLTDTALNCFINKPPYEIEVSLYGYNDNSYNNFTKTTKQFKHVLENLIKLKNAGLNITLKNIITKDNISHFDKIEEKAKELGIRFKSDYISFPKVCDKFGENSQQISAKEAVEHLKKHKGAKEHFVNLYNKPYKHNDFLFKCKNNDDTFFINSKKEVCMCVCMQSISYHYKKGNLSKIILELQKIKELTFSNNAKCKNCKYMPLCRYCPGKFYMATGSYETPPTWFCEFGKLIYETFIENKN